MYKLYNGTESLTFPNGKTYTAEQLMSIDSYAMLFVGTPVVWTSKDGITNEMAQLEDLKYNYNVTIDDAQQAINEINAIIEGSRPKPDTIATVQEQLDALTSAFTASEVTNA